MTTTRNREWLLVALIYTAIVFACFSPWWVQGHVFAPLDILNEMLLPWRGDKTYPDVHNHFVSDAVTQYLPYHLLAARSLREDGYIGWNPYGETGSPLYANTMALPGDWTLQLYRFFDFWTGWHLGLIGQFLLAGLGMLVLLRNRGITPWAALAGSIVFAGNAQFIIWFYHRWALGSFCWMPWTLWALFRWRAGKPGSIPLAAAFLAMGFLGGTLQHMVYTVLAVGCFWGGEVIGRVKPWPQKVRATLILGLIGIFGVALAWPIVWPCIQAYAQSKAAGDTRGGIGYPQGVLQVPLNAIAYGFYVFPSLLGSPQTMDAWKLLKSGLFDLGWLGALPCLVAFASIFRRSAPLTARILILVALIIPLTPLVGPLYHRVLLLFALGGAWAFADFLSNAGPVTQLKFVRWTGLAASLAVSVWTAVSIVLLWIAPILKDKIVAFVQPRLGQSQFGLFEEWFLDRARHFVDTLFIWSPEQLPLVILVGLSIGLLYLGARRKLPSQIWQGGIALVVALELVILASHWITIVDLKKFPAYAKTPEIEAIQRIVGDGRIYIGIAGHSIADDPLTPNLPDVFGIGHLEVYESVRPAGLWAGAAYASDPASLISLGVTHILSPANSIPPNGSDVLFAGPTTTLRLLPDASPPTWTTLSPNRIQIIPRNAGKSLTIPITASPRWRLTSPEVDSPSILEESPGGLVIRSVEILDQPLELVYDPGWIARHPLTLPLFSAILAGLMALAKTFTTTSHFQLKNRDSFHE